MSAEVKVMERALVSKVRRLPLPGQIMVQLGDVVTPDTVLARTDLLPGDPYVMDIAQELGLKKLNLPANLMDEVLVVQVGDRIKQDEVIARHGRGFGQVSTVHSPVTGVVEFISRVNHRIYIREDGKSANPVVIINAAKTLDVWPRMLRMYTQIKEGEEVKQGQIIAASPSALNWDCVYASVAGTVEKICTRTGTITLVRKAKPTMVDAYISGRVTHITDSESVEVATAASYVQGVFGIGGETYGRLVVVAEREQEITADMITNDHAGCVLAGGALVSLEAMQKALTVGVKALISGGANNLDLVQMAGREITIALTGLEEMPLTIVLTEGFGRMPMQERILQLLKEHEGKTVSVNGATQIRAGAIRPEVIIALEGDVNASDLPDADSLVASDGGALAEGSLVRVVSRSHYGQWGRVKRVLPDPVRLPTEALVYVVEVELESGQLVTVAESNVETAGRQ